MSREPSVSRVQLVVHGRVQGVGFRAFVAHEARALGLSGTVRNRADGSVEIEAEGAAGALEALAAAVRRGPVAARVERVEQALGEGPARYRGFRSA
jgi:acylphosphatase